MTLSRGDRRTLRQLERRLRRKDKPFVLRFQRIITAAMAEPPRLDESLPPGKLTQQ
jgi:hypothetical protein